MSITIDKGLSALRLYRRIMKLHIRNMPMDLRYFGKVNKINKIGDLYVKQEFRLHLDKATDDQMDKFLGAWDKYAVQIEKVNPKKPKAVKKAFANQEFDQLMKEKVSQD